MPVYQTSVRDIIAIVPTKGGKTTMAIERFHIHVSDEILDDLKYRLHHTRWPDQIENAGWERGTELSYLKSLISY